MAETQQNGSAAPSVSEQDLSQIANPSPASSQDNAVIVPADVVPPLAMSEVDPDESPAFAADSTLPSALFVLPFPAPVNAHRSKNTAPFLVYSPPRAIYKKPGKKDNGKRPKEKILKKAVRLWQEEVEMGEKIKRGELPNPSRFKKIRGGCIRLASTINKWLPNSCIETLSRLPPQHKLGSVTLIHPAFQGASENNDAEDQDYPYQPTPDELRNDMSVLLRKTRKRVLKRAILSGMILPISLGIDVFAPVFAFEINVTYFAFQIYGLRKAKALIATPEKKRAKRAKKAKKDAKNASEHATLLVDNAPADVPEGQLQESGSENRTFRTKALQPPALDPVLILMYEICSKLDPVSFPPLTEPEGQATPSDGPPSSSATLPPNLKRPGGEVVKQMIQAFKQIMPADVAERYCLDEEFVSEDLARYIKKASKEYIDSLNGRADRKGVLGRVKTWRKNSVVKKEKAVQITREKRLAKKNNAEPSASA